MLAQAFAQCMRLSEPGVVERRIGMSLQPSLAVPVGLTMPEQELRAYRRRVDWIQTYIFPGSELAFLGEIQKSVARVAQLSLSHLESFGLHYAKTLELWHQRFFQKLGTVEALGFPERFQRMWDFYLSWCEGAFRERYINVVHLLMTKNGSARPPEFPTRLPAEEFSAS